MKTQSFVAVLLSVVAQCAFAARQGAGQATNQTDFAKVVANVRAEMAADGRYAEVAGSSAPASTSGSTR
jgi:hypothetical protein